MKIYYIFYEYLDGALGGGSHIWEISENFAALGHETILFCPRIRKFRKETSLKVKYLFCIDFSIIRIITYNLSVFFYLLYDCLRRPPDIIYYRESLVFPAPLLISLIFRIPLVVEVNSDSLLDLEGTISPILYSLLKWYQNRVYEYGNKFIYVSKGLKKIFKMRYPHRGTDMLAVSNGTNAAHFKPMEPGQCREKLGLEREALVVGFIGTFLAHQGINNLIACASRVISQFPQVRFLMVGDGPLRRSIETSVNELELKGHFIFAGAIPYRTLPLYINAMDVCAAPYSMTRNAATGISPLKLFDYLSCGKPVVGSNIPEMGNIIRESEAGIVVEPDNTIELAEAITRLLADANLRNRLGSNGRKLILDKYNWTAIARTILEYCTIAAMKK